MFRSASACAPTATSRWWRRGRSARQRERRYLAALLRELRGAARASSPAARSRACTWAAARRRCCGPNPWPSWSRRCAARSPARGPVEVTLEVNPSTLERGRLPGFRAAGVTRLSVGIQSFDDTVLRRLGRAHRAERGARHARRLPGDRLRRDLARPDLRRAGPDARQLRARSRRGDRLRARSTSRPTSSRSRRGLPSRRPPPAAGSRGPTRSWCSRCRSSPRRGCGTRACAATRSRTTRGRASKRSTTGATGSDGRCWGSASAPSRTDPPGAAGALRRAAREPARARRLSRVHRAGPLSGGRAARAARRGHRPRRGDLPGPARGGVDAARFAGEFGEPPRSFYRAQIEALAEAGLLEEQDGGDLRLTARGRQLADHVCMHFV